MDIFIAGLAVGSALTALFMHFINRARQAQGIAEAVGEVKAGEAAAVAQARALEVTISKRIPQLEARAVEIEQELKLERNRYASLSVSESALKTKVEEAGRQIVDLQSKVEDGNKKHSELVESLVSAREDLKEKATLALQLPELRALAQKWEDDWKTTNAELTRLKADEATFNARVEELKNAHERLKAEFSALSGDALKKNNEIFLQIAKTEIEKAQTSGASDLEKRQKAIEELVKPIREGLEKYDERLSKVDKERMETYGRLMAEVEKVNAASLALKTETTMLASALRSPSAKGQWGELQLRRIVELTGMIEHCDFQTQVTVHTDDGKLRPDLVVRMPRNKTVVVDSKVPLKAYLEAFDVLEEDQKAEKLKEHAVQLRRHMDLLSAKAYWDQFENSPEIVLMFLPYESMLSVALQHDPTIIEDGINQRVMIATPTTLITHLRVVAFGWHQEQIAENARAVSDAGRELYKRIQTFAEHFAKVGKSLKGAIGAYNDATGSLENRVLSQARKLKELRVTPENEIIPTADQIELAPRELQAEELKQLPEAKDLESE